MNLLKVVLINGSPKKKDSSSGIFLSDVREKIVLMDSNKEYLFSEVAITNPFFSETDIQLVKESDLLVFAFPLYVDGIPSHILPFLERMEKELSGIAGQKYVYVIVNAGFYDGHQNQHAIGMMKHWAKKAGVIWGQGFGVGAGGMLANMKQVPPGKGIRKNYGLAFDKFITNMVMEGSGEDLLVSPNFPRFLYVLAGNFHWDQAAKKNGVNKRDLGRQRDL